MKDFEHSDLISTRYLSEIDEDFVSTLNLCPPFAIGAFMVLRFSGALVVHHPNIVKSMLYGTADALVVHGRIFRFACDNIQQITLHEFVYWFITAEDETLLFDFFSNPQRSQHHSVDHRTHLSITERCFSYVLNCRLALFPGVYHSASKSKCRPWLWRWRKPKGLMTNSQNFRWRQKEHVRCYKKLVPFQWLVLALKYLPYLLDKATASRELIALAKMWSYRYPLLVSLFPHDTMKAGKAVEHYLSRLDGQA
jgi:hypothetical protein